MKLNLIDSALGEQFSFSPCDGGKELHKMERLVWASVFTSSVLSEHTYTTVVILLAYLKEENIQ